jgi:hypothetical protein
MDQKYLESFEMWYWRRMEKIRWPDRVENEEKKNEGTKRQGVRSKQLLYNLKEKWR